MPELTIRLRIDPETGKKDIVISMQSDDDALPHEHEQLHRHLVDQLIEGGLVQASEVGKIVVEREEETGQVEPPRETEQSETSRARQEAEQ